MGKTMGTTTQGSKLLSGLTNKSPSGDSGMRIDKLAGSLDNKTTRDSTARGHTIGGRTA